MVHEVAGRMLQLVVPLVLTRGRFRIKKSTSSLGKVTLQLILSITVAADAVGFIGYLVNKVGGSLHPRNFGNRSYFVWEIHERELIIALIGFIDEMRDDDLELSSRMSQEIEIAWRFLHIEMKRGRLTSQEKKRNAEAMNERLRLYMTLRDLKEADL